MESLFPDRASITVELPNKPEFSYTLFELSAEDEAVIFDMSLDAAAAGMNVGRALKTEHEVVARSMLPGVEMSLADLKVEVRKLSREHLNFLFDKASELNGLEYTRENYKDLKDLEQAKKS